MYKWDAKDYQNSSSEQQKWAEGLCAWIRTTWLPYTQRVPENLRNTFINELADRYTAHHPLDSDGNIHIEMVRLEIEAQKP